MKNGSGLSSTWKSANNHYGAVIDLVFRRLSQSPKAKAQTKTIPKCYRSMGMEERLEHLENTVSSLPNGQQQIMDRLVELFQEEEKVPFASFHLEDEAQLCGLKENIKANVLPRQPSSLFATIVLARVYEARNTLSRKINFPDSKKNPLPSIKGFHPGHRCQRLFMIEACNENCEEDGDVEMEIEDTKDEEEPGSGSICVEPYHYPYYENAEIEKLEYKKGKENIITDALSRKEENEEATRQPYLNQFQIGWKKLERKLPRALS
ncbi:hypothetical protein FEM48_Zijuj07G0017100 [Ziziphus jujuba var. spinosa]|uniref:Uncharacterized protein n=1 Tax=Ziziphus jujuba var. spinosa TaxID=714518 RepID=A0A978V1Q5_ZIZJJ|nr:hypothetical protein FEM48_Zijuj07G0017100 [Ziziphus jujuba var. spinosa]